MKKKLLIILSLFTYFLSAQNPADLDRKFVPVYDVTAYTEASAAALAVQSDGKIIKCRVDDYGTVTIIRLNSNGTRDLSFNLGEIKGSVFTITIQSDRKIIVGGSISAFNGISGISNVIRLNSDGTLDSSFNLRTGLERSVNSLATQTDGKIIAGGDLYTLFGQKVNNFVRLNTDGTIDSSFNTGTGFNGTVSTTFIQTDGKIIVGGNFTNYNGITVNSILRLNTDGTIDLSFNIGAEFTMTPTADGNPIGPPIVYSIAMQTDGKIIASGYFNAINGVKVNNIARFNSDGTIDQSFNIGTGFNSGTGFTSEVRKMTIQRNGKIIIGQNSVRYYPGRVDYDYNIIRLNTDGTIDSSFAKGGFDNKGVRTMAMQPDGKIIASGDFTTFNSIKVNRIIQLNTDGTIDPSFNAGTGFDITTTSIAIQSDKKIIIGGYFSTFNGITANGIIRLNTDGTRDTSFNAGTGVSGYIGSGVNPGVEAIAIQSDGRIILGGVFKTFNGITANGIIRLNTDGTRDTSFKVGTGFDRGIRSIAIQPDGKIVIGGEFSTFNGITANGIIRLITDGTRDTSFNVGTGVSGSIFASNYGVGAIAIQSDGRIILGGGFKNFNGAIANGIIRLLSNGTIDYSLGLGSGRGFDCEVRSITIQSDKKIIIGGDFTTFEGMAANHIIRLWGNGTKDNSFNIGTGFFKPFVGGEGDFRINKIVTLTDGKIIVGGNFSNFNGMIANNLIQLNRDGTKDTSFNIDTRLQATSRAYGVRSIAIQNDGQIIVGGNFNNYNNVSVGRIIRLRGSLVNDAPIAMPDQTTVSKGDATTTLDDNTTSVLASDYDSENNILSAVLVSGVSKGTLILFTDGTFRYTHNGSDTTSDSFTYKANDGNTDSNAVTVTITISKSLSNDSFEKAIVVKAYPNPTNDIVVLTIPDEFVLEKIELYNSLGQFVEQYITNTISLQKLAGGNYFLKIYTSGGNITKKIIKV